MYNEEIKLRFLSSDEKYSNTRGKQYLSDFAETERRLNKDIAEMNKAEVIQAFDEFGFDEYGTIKSAIAIIKTYVAWCIDNKVFQTIPEGIMYVKASDVDLSKSLQEQAFLNENALISTLRMVRNFDEGYPEPVVLCLAWLGLLKKEVLTLRDSQVDLVNRRIFDDKGNTIVSWFSDEILEIFQQFVDCKSATRESGPVEKEVIKDMSTDFFLKKMVTRNSTRFGQPFSLVQLDSALNKLINKSKELGIERPLTFLNVWRSGRFFQMWMTEARGIDVMSPKNRPVVEEIFRNSKNYHDAKKMYGFYKKAFNK